MPKAPPKIMPSVLPQTPNVAHTIERIKYLFSLVLSHIKKAPTAPRVKTACGTLVISMADWASISGVIRNNARKKIFATGLTNFLE